MKSVDFAKKKMIAMSMILLMLCMTLTGCSAKQETATVRVGSMKGPTSMGLVRLMELDEQEQTKNNYEFTMEATADMLLPSMISGDLDIALVPANVAAVLYQKTEGGVCVIDINTLGVLYVVSADTSIDSMDDLKGRTIYLPRMRR